MRRAFRNNGLSVVLFTLFFVFLVGQSVAGHRAFNEEQVGAPRPPRSRTPPYLTEGHFVEATFENWESEFLQMFAYVLLTVYLVQRGSPESRPIDDDDEDVGADACARLARAGAAPAAGGAPSYSHSLTIALGLLFLRLVAVLHALGGAQVAGDEAQAARQ